jgi:electron transfer flavoprotein alpha subunit
MSSSGLGICVYSEKESIILELLSKARDLADSIGTWAAVAHLGGNPPDPKLYGEYGADKILVGTNDLLREFNPDVTVQALHQILSNVAASLIMIGATKEGREIGARLAQRFNSGYSSECTEILFANDAIYADRPTLAGTYFSHQRLLGKPSVVSVSPRRFPANKQASPRSPEMIETKLELTPPRSTVVEARSRGATGDVELEKADTIIAIGRGLKRKEDISMIEDLARAVGGEVGCSRPLSEDLKWLPESRQVGLSGHKVQPKLYIACGVSGQMQHVAGMLNSKVVVAINTDAKAPIFEHSDYGIVADIYKFVPALTACIQKLKQKSS